MIVVFLCQVAFSCLSLFSTGKLTLVHCPGRLYPCWRDRNLLLAPGVPVTPRGSLTPPVAGGQMLISDAINLEASSRN